VKLCLEGTMSPMAPASILRTHPNATVYLDKQSASLLGPALQSALTEASQVMVSS
jgi:glucosamine-6-phosphate deaminase